MFLRFIQVVACIRISFLFKAEKYSVVSIYHVSFIRLSVHEHLVCLHLLAILNNTAKSIGIQVSI